MSFEDERLDPVREILDMVRRISLRVPGVTQVPQAGEGHISSASIISLLNEITKAVPVNRPMLIGRVISLYAKQDPEVLKLLRSSAVASHIRQELSARSEGHLKEALPLTRERSRVAGEAVESASSPKEKISD